MMRSKFKVVMEECQQIVVSHLMPLLANMFENSDVALLEFAEKAESNTAQQRFFEAMKEIRVKRSIVETLFQDELEKGFRHFMTTDSSASDKAGQEVEDGFSLLEKDVAEENVALQNMLSKANMNFSNEIYALQQRLALVIGGRKLEANEVPGGPEQIAECFRIATQELELAPKLKIIVYVLFDKFVMSKAGDLLKQYNQRLVEAGLLKNLKYEIRKRPNAKSGPAPAGQEAPEEMQASAADGSMPGGAMPGGGMPGGGMPGGGMPGGAAQGSATAAPMQQPVTGQGSTVGEELFDTICQLLSRRPVRGGMPMSDGAGSTGAASAAAPAAGASGASASGAAQGSQEPAGSMGEGGAPGGMIGHPQLVSAIHNVQVEEDATSPVSQATLDSQLIPDIRLDTGLIESIKSTLQEQRNKLFGTVDRRRVASADADVIDLVGMIFEYMLNDENIPNAVKALLSRLHTPFLKVAILDKHFFTQEDHPARRLLNVMADAGIRYVVETDLKRGIFPYMRAVVNRIMDEFKDELSIFAEVLAEFENRLEQMQHTAEVTEQRSKEAASGQEKLQSARQRAHKVIQDVMQGNIVPAAIVQLLEQAWADKLMFILLRDRDGEQGQFWKTAVRIAKDIVWSTEPRSTDDARDKLREDLPELQAYMRDGLKLLANFGSGDSERLMSLISDCQEAALDPLRAMEVAEASKAQVKPKLAPKTAASAEEEEEKAKQESEKATQLTPKEEEMLDVLEYVEFGTWFEFSNAGKPPLQRLKLAWFTQLAGHYMFVDGLGAKAAVKSKLALAKEMAQGNAKIVVEEKQPFVDRAMEAVRSLLRREDKRRT